jgi:hypothetical protein
VGRAWAVGGEGRGGEGRAGQGRGGAGYGIGQLRRGPVGPRDGCERERCAWKWNSSCFPSSPVLPPIDLAEDVSVLPWGYG